MPRILVLFASRHGQTRQIAFRLAETLRARGGHVHLRDIADESPDPSHYDLVVVGSPVYIGKHDVRIGRWAAQHHVTLNGRPTAFFSVSMSASSTRPEVLSLLEASIVRFTHDAVWRPTSTTRFAGALRYTAYDRVTRWIIKMISGSQGRPTDTTRDHEFTDWAGVDAYAHELVDLAQLKAAA